MSSSPFVVALDSCRHYRDRWQARHTWWICAYRTVGRCGGGFESISGSFAVVQPSRSLAEPDAREFLARSLPSGTRATFTLRRPGLLTLLFGD